MHANNIRIERLGINRELNIEQRNLQNELIDMTNSNNTRTEDLQYQRQRHLLKCIDGYETRFKSLSIGRWRDAVSEINIKEQGAYTIMRRLRLRYLRKCIDLYLEGVAFRKKCEKEEEKVAMYNRIRNERLQAKMINAWLIFKKRHQTAKDYWYRVLLRLDLSRKRQSVKKWVEVSQQRLEKSLKTNIQDREDTIADLNHNIGELYQLSTDQQQGISERKKLMLAQAQRILSNKFARFHSVNLTRGFEKWREVITFYANRDRLLEKACSHIRKSQFYCVRAAFRNWIQHANIKERIYQIKRETMHVEDTKF